jgi:hypothetical protein
LFLKNESPPRRADFPALYKFGKWQIGPVGYFEVQTTNDTGGCNPVPGVNFCGRYQTAAAGGLIGYVNSRGERYPRALCG